MKSARTLYYPKPVHPTTSRKPPTVRHSFIDNSNMSKEELKQDERDKPLYELATIEKEIRQRDLQILKIQKLPIKNKRIHFLRTLKRPKNPMIRDREFIKSSLNDIETDSSIDSNYDCPILNE